ncbi:MAG: hypothetical protein EOR60_09595 [Mesorhizobium sp.]|nr:MAG: hypothetical protein EOR60_09595 [Mesorhizobium sp.]
MTKVVSLSGRAVPKVTHVVKLANIETKAERRARWKREDRYWIHRLQGAGMNASNSKAVALMRQNFIRKYGELP